MIKSTFEVKTIGEVLKEKREKKGLRLKQVAEITRIRTEYLIALEKGDYSAFPSEVYIKGFLKNYAKFLGIDQEKSQAMYRRDNMHIQKSKIESKKFKPKKLDFTLTPEKLIIAIVAVITVSIIYYIGSQVSTILKKPELSISSPVIIGSDQKGEYTTSDTKIAIKGKISAGSTLKLNGDDVITNNLEQFEVRDQELNTGKNEFIFVAESQFGRQTKATLTVNFSESTVVEDSTISSTPPANFKMKLTLKVVNDIANVLVQTDGTTKINQVLQPGTTKEYNANTSIVIQTPRPANITIEINGKKYTISTSDKHEWKFINGIVVQNS